MRQTTPEYTMRTFRSFGLFFAVLLALPAVMHGQLVQEFKPPRANCCLASLAQGFADQLQDWNQLGRYHEDTMRLQAQPAEGSTRPSETYTHLRHPKELRSP